MPDLFLRFPLEVHQTIFDTLHKNGTKEELTPYLTVNKCWFALISRRIYKEVKLHALWHLRDSPNAEYYLSNICSLTFGLGDQVYHPEIIQKWTQPPLQNLEKISFMPGAVFQGHDVDYIIPYLPPSVSTVQLFGARWNFGLLSALRETCRGLRELSIKYPFKGKDFSLDAQGFDSWLQEFPSLYSMSVFYTDGNGNETVTRNAWSQLFSQPTLCSLLARPLRRLRLEHRMSDWEYLFNSVTFDSLRELSIIVKPEEISNFPIFADLRKLHISVDGECKEEQHEVLSPICSMTGLKSLRVIFVKPYKLYSSEVMSLTRLTNLKELEIFSSHHEVIGIDSDNDDDDDDDDKDRTKYMPIRIVPSFDENDFDLLASSLRNLRHVCLLFGWQPDSSHVLKSAAYLWRELEYLCLGTNLDLPESILVSGNGYPVFPNMKRLMKVRAYVGDLATDTESIRDDRDALLKYVNDICQNIKVALPRIEGIRFHESYIYDNNPEHQRIGLTQIMADALADNNIDWDWSRYGVDRTWDFGYIV
uniref:Serine/threonine-protein kinase tel1 n=1 Tax=Talaromyces marneffei PM1 TaxID=1077442 RepID=A0A093VZ42_TALMA